MINILKIQTFNTEFGRFNNTSNKYSGGRKNCMVVRSQLQMSFDKSLFLEYVFGQGARKPTTSCGKRKTKLQSKIKSKSLLLSTKGLSTKLK